MTIQELYDEIDGDYDQVIRVLRMDKLVDKHIRKFTKNNVVENLLEAGETLDPTQMFETAHALKGVCGNLGLKGLYDLASELSDEFRPGNERQRTDDEVKAVLDKVRALYEKTAAGIAAYEESNQ
ncbi:MAG: Hpt domain-containing protein [Eubacterium sp.]|nr:Hpt domain-containing protein [Eubacterium sp.]